MKPPDWKAAQLHGRANKILWDYGPIDLDDEESYCPCCSKQYPIPGKIYPLNKPTLEIAEKMGSGYPLFLKMMKFISLILIV